MAGKGRLVLGKEKSNLKLSPSKITKINIIIGTRKLFIRPKTLSPFCNIRLHRKKITRKTKILIGKIISRLSCNEANIAAENITQTEELKIKNNLDDEIFSTTWLLRPNKNLKTK